MRIFAVLSAFAGVASAIRLPPQIRSTGSPHVVNFEVRRALRSNNPLLNGSIANLGFQSYVTNVRVGVRNFTLSLDTGSSDLWVYTSKSPSVVNLTDLSLNLTNGIGSAVGVVAYAPVAIDAYNITNQAILIANQTEEIDGQGVLGLGFDSNSSIYNATGNSSGAVTPLSNIFALNASAANASASNASASNASRTSSNFIGLDLTRAPDGRNSSIGGTFTISSYLSNFSAVANATRIPIMPNATGWQIPVGGVFVNGTAYNVSQDAPDGGNATALIDSGTSYAVVPQTLSNLIYQIIPGAKACPLGDGQVWLVPCLGTSNVTFEFGGEQFPVHPLDMTNVQIYTQNSTRYAACIGVFTSPASVPTLGELPIYILGDSFMRNVYTSFNFGNNTLAGNFSSSGTGPSVQFLSKSNDTNAIYTEFLTQRNQTLSSLNASTIDPNSIDCQSVEPLFNDA
ncbi:hypothetical protein EWM64_g2445 [Hericium alpestre]|uniref:Peptidase A1 domain-containing protein n=1 Tax=Hericium alpestre TaxID=135208 RepID=A0A4Z0A5Q9_9AGAM|nr:hypothetical protein EWM64_g2445 [Hericium alpestre]